MLRDDMFFNKPIINHGEKMLQNFYSRRRSQSDPDPFFDPVFENKRQKLLKARLTEQYIRLLKENDYLRVFIKKNKLKIKGSKIHSTLDGLHSDKTGVSVSFHLDKLESKISSIFPYF
jgi:hypothetical protein